MKLKVIVHEAEEGDSGGSSSDTRMCNSRRLLRIC